MLHQSFFLQKVKECIRTIGTIVGIDQKPINPDRTVIGQPFQDKRPFVLHRGDDGHAPWGHDFAFFGIRDADGFFAEGLRRKRQERVIFDEACFRHDL